MIDRNGFQGIELQHLDLLPLNRTGGKVEILENRWAHPTGEEIVEGVIFGEGIAFALHQTKTGEDRDCGPIIWKSEIRQIGHGLWHT